MARPAVEQLNSTSRGAGFDRIRAAPGVEVNAPIIAPDPANSFTELAKVLGVATNVITNEAAYNQEKKIKREQELLTAKAEADTWGGTVDDDLYLKSKTYADRVAVVSASKDALEESEKIKADFADWRKKNPYASEEEARTFLRGRMDQFLKPNGQPSAYLIDPRQGAIVEHQLNMTAFQLISEDRDVLQKNLFDKGVSAATAALISVGRQNKGLKPTDFEATRNTLAALGATPEQINKELTSVALAVGKELKSPDPLRALPAAWADGTPAPRGDPELSRLLDNQADVQEAKNKAAYLESLEPQRLQFRLEMDDKAARGEAPTDADFKRGLELGFSAESLAAFPARARAQREEEQARAEAAAKDAERHAELMGALTGDPFSVDNGKAEDGWGREFNTAVQRGGMSEGRKVVSEAIRTRGVLPSTYKNFVNKVPTNAKDFAGWYKEVAWVRNQDPQVYAGLSEYSRTSFEAYGAIMASGRYNEAQAFQRLQSRNPDTGKRVLGSNAGRAAVRGMVGNNPTPYGLEVANRLVETFGSLEDIPEQEALELAQKSFNATYFTYEGFTYHKAFGRNEHFIRWSKQRYAKESTNRGHPVDWEDLVMAPVGDGSTFVFRERNGLPLDTVPATVLFQAYGQEAQANRAKADAPKAAARANLNPFRYIKGESTSARTLRINAENVARRDLGLPRITTPGDARRYNAKDK